MKKHSIDKEDKTKKNFSAEFFMGTKISLLILSIPFLVIFGNFLIVGDVVGFILYTLLCAFAIFAILFSSVTDI